MSELRRALGISTLMAVFCPRTGGTLVAEHDSNYTTCGGRILRRELRVVDL